MLHEFSRTELLIGKDAFERLQKSRVAIFGVGGVGSFTVEALVRAGVGHFVLVDDDRICLTNLNRQLHATRKTVGQYKVDAMRERILEINPDADIQTHKVFYLPGGDDDLIAPGLDYVVDAVDTVAAKLTIVQRAKELNIPVISCMGAGNKLDPSLFKVADIYKTSVCPLAKVMRRELRRRNIDSLKVVYSEEQPLPLRESEATSCKTGCICPPGVKRTCLQRRSVPGSISFVPSTAGLILAGEVVRDLIAGL